MLPPTDQETTSLIGTIIIGLISGFVSITRRILGKKSVSKLWVLSECAGVILVTALAMDVYPVIHPMLMESPTTSWITTVEVGLCSTLKLSLIHNSLNELNLKNYPSK